MQFLYKDPNFVAINKPSNLLVHRSAIDKHETRFAMQMVRDALGQRVFPVHRLDKPTSGVLLFALDRDTAKSLTNKIVENTINKTYLCITRGYIPESAVINYPLKEKFDKTTDLNAKRNKPPQSAITTYRRLAITELPYAVGRYNTARYSLVTISTQTGRRHQIRRHMKHIFHPIIGDTTHGDGKHNDFFRKQFGLDRLLLHASSISLQHPCTQESIEIEAPLDETFARMVELFSG